MSSKPTSEVLRQALLLILLFGIIGTQLELLLLTHTDGVWQLAPLLLNGIALGVLAWYGAAKSAASVRSLQGVMALHFVSGTIGLGQHFYGNLGYARDSNPSLSGIDLYAEALRGSTPTLAPGTMILLALVGFAFAFRHPRLRGAVREDELPFHRNAP